VHPVRPDTKAIATISGLAFLVLFSLWLLFAGVDRIVMAKAATKGGAILTVIGAFWAFYTKIGWRVTWLRLGGWLSNVPDLRGRWEGIVCRHKDDIPHPFVIEISQTYGSLTYRTFSTHSKGESITSAIFADETGQVFKVISTWRVTTRKINDRTEEDTFYGTSIWNISLDGERKLIEDDYFTGREPPTKGTLKMDWKAHKLSNKFR
jgi:hypothetical protein